MKIKNCFFRWLFVCTAFLPLASQAQYWGGLGYHASFGTGLENLNYVLKKYNSNNDYLNVKFKDVKYLGGWAVKAGMWKKASYLDLGFARSGHLVSASGTKPSDKERQRDIKVTMNSWEISYGKIFGNETNVTWGLGVMASLGYMKVRNRFDEIQIITHSVWTNPNPVSKFFINPGIQARVMLWDPGITLEPYWRFSIFGLGKSDASSLNKLINPDTYATDKSPLNFTSSAVGLKVLFSVTTR